MSAEILRRAASLMRERAEACLDENTGLDEEPWYRLEDATAPVVRTKWVAFAESNLEDAAHIASWHPAVALAVADWLDDTATFAAQEAESLDMPHLRDAVDPYAVAVARAYLGVGPVTEEACSCWNNSATLGHEGHCCLLRDDRATLPPAEAWRADEDVCHVPGGRHG